MNDEHEPGCPTIADDESDEVLDDFQECCCSLKGQRAPTIEDIRAHTQRVMGRKTMQELWRDGE